MIQHQTPGQFRMIYWFLYHVAQRRVQLIRFVCATQVNKLLQFCPQECTYLHMSIKDMINKNQELLCAQI